MDNCNLTTLQRNSLSQVINEADLIQQELALRDPWYFITKYVWTLDEHDIVNPVRRFPALQYLDFITEIWMKRKLLLIAKTRQMMITWLMAGLHLWLVLRQGKLILFLSKKEDDADKILKRTEFIYKRLPRRIKWGCVQRWDINRDPPFKSTHSKGNCKMEFNWLDSSILALSQEPEGVRSLTASAVFADEFAYQNQAEDTFVACKPSIDGGGSFTGVSTPNFQEYFFELCFDLNKSGTMNFIPNVKLDSGIKGLSIKQNKNSFTVMFLHYTADPSKDNDEYRKTIRAGFTDEQLYRKEYELDFSSKVGAKVIPNFSVEQIKTNLDFISNKPIYAGTDWGFSHPAHILTQFNNDNQWLWLRSFTGNNMLTTTFLEIIKYLRGHFSFEMLSEEARQYVNVNEIVPWIEYPLGRNYHFIDYCDIAGNAQSDRGIMSNIEIARQSPYNILMRFGKSSVEVGVNILGIRMKKRQKDGLYGILIDDSNKMIVQGLSGCFVRDSKGNIPDDIYTHIFDAVRYIITNISNEAKEQRLCQGDDVNWGNTIRFKNKPNIISVEKYNPNYIDELRAQYREKRVINL